MGDGNVKLISNPETPIIRSQRTELTYLLNRFTLAYDLIKRRYYMLPVVRRDDLPFNRSMMENLQFQH